MRLRRRADWRADLERSQSTSRIDPLSVTPAVPNRLVRLHNTSLKTEIKKKKKKPRGVCVCLFYFFLVLLWFVFMHDDNVRFNRFCAIAPRLHNTVFLTAPALRHTYRSVSPPICPYCTCSAGPQQQPASRASIVCTKRERFVWCGVVCRTGTRRMLPHRAVWFEDGVGVKREKPD